MVYCQILEDLSKLVIRTLANSLRTNRPEDFIYGIKDILNAHNLVTSNDNWTLFSCDSFCEPHLEIQSNFLKSAQKLNLSTSCLNIPITHYLNHHISCQQNTSEDFLKFLPNMNLQLLTLQTNSPSSFDKSQDLLRIGSEKDILMSELLHGLLKSYGHSLIKKIYIGSISLMELSLTDICHSWKCSPSAALSPNSFVYKHTIKAAWLLLWQYLLLLTRTEIGAYCFAQSYYSPTALFIEFCKATNREFRFLVPSRLFSHNNLETGEYYIRILETPEDTCQHTHPKITKLLKYLNPGSIAKKLVMDLIDLRMSGIGADAYSPNITNETEEKLLIEKKINYFTNLSSNVFALYTSSMDEAYVKDLHYKQLSTNVDHLHDSPFKNQEEWIDETIAHFIIKRRNDLLIIRFHPRLTSNKRDQVDSLEFLEYWDAISARVNKYPNIILIHPSSNISSYWLAAKAHVILNGWSSIGIELALTDHKVFNAFSICTPGGASISPIHANSPPIISIEDYIDRIEKVCLLEREDLLDLNLIISKEEAVIAFLLINETGLVNLNSPLELLSQISTPSLITKSFLARISI